MREQTTDKANNVGTSRCGTVGYIPTEVFRGEPHTIRSDVFSLGVTLYEMIHGKVRTCGDPRVVYSRSLVVQLPYGITHRHRDMKVVYDLMMTQPLVFGAHVDLLMRDLLTKVRTRESSFSNIADRCVEDAGSRPL